MHTARRSVVVLQHVPFEDLGSLQAPLCSRGFEIATVDACTAEFPLPAAQTCDLLIVLGGPIGVYDSREYPFLQDELACIRARFAERRPVLGICLGAQLMAAALGARVYPGSSGAEIGWAPLTAGAATPSWFQTLLAPGLSLFHWHGDTFDLPPGATHLASSALYANQAFTVGDHGLALQFHPEVTANALERWYVGHACELNQKGIHPADLRTAARIHGPALEKAADAFWHGWLDATFS